MRIPYREDLSSSSIEIFAVWYSHHVVVLIRQTLCDVLLSSFVHTSTILYRIPSCTSCARKKRRYTTASVSNVHRPWLSTPVFMGMAAERFGRLPNDTNSKLPAASQSVALEPTDRDDRDWEVSKARCEHLRLGSEQGKADWDDRRPRPNSKYKACERRLGRL